MHNFHGNSQKSDQCHVQFSFTLWGRDPKMSSRLMKSVRSDFKQSTSINRKYNDSITVKTQRKYLFKNQILVKKYLFLHFFEVACQLSQEILYKSRNILAGSILKYLCYHDIQISKLQKNPAIAISTHRLIFFSKILKIRILLLSL